MEYTNCCGAPFGSPGWPDCDLCTDCKEHAEPREDDEDEITPKYSTYLSTEALLMNKEYIKDRTELFRENGNGWWWKPITKKQLRRRRIK